MLNPYPAIAGVNTHSPTQASVRHDAVRAWRQYDVANTAGMPAVRVAQLRQYAEFFADCAAEVEAGYGSRLPGAGLPFAPRTDPGNLYTLAHGAGVTPATVRVAYGLNAADAPYNNLNQTRGGRVLAFLILKDVYDAGDALFLAREDGRAWLSGAFTKKAVYGDLPGLHLDGAQWVEAFVVTPCMLDATGQPDADHHMQKTFRRSLLIDDGRRALFLEACGFRPDFYRTNTRDLTHRFFTAITRIALSAVGTRVIGAVGDDFSHNPYCVLRGDVVLAQAPIVAAAGTRMLPSGVWVREVLMECALTEVESHAANILRCSCHLTAEGMRHLGLQHLWACFCGNAIKCRMLKGARVFVRGAPALAVGYVPFVLLPPHTF
jgi:hypothetical protein